MGLLHFVEFPISREGMIDLMLSVPMEKFLLPSEGKISTQVNFDPKPMVVPRIPWKLFLGYLVEGTLLRSKGI